MNDDIILKIENVSKQYRLGVIGTGTISHDFNRWWAKIRGKEDPYLKISEVNDRATKGKSKYLWALKDLNFEVKRGEILGIIGKNGAGKSTLLKILSQVTGPTTGIIKSKGRIASLLEVGTGFHPEMTGKQNVFLNGAILGMTKKEIASKLDEIVTFSGCERYINTPVKRYSSGMKVRLAFAIAAHLEPDILVVDEVLAVGDVEFQKKAIGKMQDISNTDGRTVLFVSHNMTAVQNLCTKALIIDNGKISFIGDVAKAINKYVLSNTVGAEVSLLDRKDRKGNQILSFTKIAFNKGKPVFVGESLSIELHYESKENIDDLVIAFIICRGYDERIMVIDSSFQGEKIKATKGSGLVTIELPKLYILSGEYSINIWSAAKGDVLDYVINATSLSIDDMDVYRTGKSLNSNQHGVFYPEKCLWDC